MASSALDRLPPLATTGVGSLPFDDPAAAVRHAARAYDVPFCPQLPRSTATWSASGSAATRAAAAGARAATASARPAGTRSRELAATRPPVHRVVKLQVTGPVTLAVRSTAAAPVSPARSRSGSR